MANDVVSSKTGLALEIYAKTLSAFNRKNVMKELCTVQTIQNGYMHRFYVNGVGTDSDVDSDFQLGDTIDTSQLSIAKKDIVVERTMVVRKRIDNWEKKAATFDMVKTAVEQNAQAMATKIDKKIFEQLDIAVDSPELKDSDDNKVIQPQSGVVTHNGMKDASSSVRGDAVLEAIFSAGAFLSSNDRTGKQRYAVVSPQLYADLVLSQKAVNADYNPGNNGSIKDGKVLRINDTIILTSNNIQETGLKSQEDGHRLHGKIVKGWVLTEDVVGITELIGLTTDEWEDKKEKCLYLDVEYAAGFGVLDQTSLVALVVDE